MQRNHPEQVRIHHPDCDKPIISGNLGHCLFNSKSGCFPDFRNGCKFLFYTILSDNTVACCRADQIQIVVVRYIVHNPKLVPDG